MIRRRIKYAWIALRVMNLLSCLVIRSALCTLRVVRRNQPAVGEDPCGLREELNQDDGVNYPALWGDGNYERAASHAAFAASLFGIAANQATLQTTQITTENSLRFKRHRAHLH